MTSNFLNRKADVNKYGVIYGGAQKVGLIRLLTPVLGCIYDSKLHFPLEAAIECIAAWRFILEWHY